MKGLFRMLAATAISMPAMALPGSASAEGVTGPAIAGTRLDVTARGLVKRVPDMAVISAGVVTQAIDAKAAMSANATAMARVIAELRRAGVAERDMATAQIALAPQYRYADNRPPVITGYQASNNVSVRFRDIAKSGAILDALVTAGANQINGPTLTIDKPEAALDEARTDAMRIARSRADLYAKAAGLSVKRIVMISESGDGNAPVPVPYARGMMAQTAAKDTEVIPGEQEVGITLSVTFELG